MVSIAAITALCAVSISFYLRFLIALCKECRRHRICYFVRLEPGSEEYLIPHTQELGTSISRAA
jgi:uncharacterized protein (UPF0179 family)